MIVRIVGVREEPTLAGREPTAVYCILTGEITTLAHADVKLCFFTTCRRAVVGSLIVPYDARWHDDHWRFP
jgi:hypothetical protein